MFINYRVHRSELSARRSRGYVAPYMTSEYMAAWNFHFNEHICSHGRQMALINQGFNRCPAAEHADIMTRRLRFIN